MPKWYLSNNIYWPFTDHSYVPTSLPTVTLTHILIIKKYLFFNIFLREIFTFESLLVLVSNKIHVLQSVTVVGYSWNLMLPLRLSIFNFFYYSQGMLWNDTLASEVIKIKQSHCSIIMAKACYRMIKWWNIILLMLLY